MPNLIFRSMKILHTADWHIGKILHKHSLAEEMQLFFDWLLQTIKSEAVDLLLVSGDIFDTATPSSKDRTTYYRFLKQLATTNTQAIITGGNHDSVGVLNAPSEILDVLDIHVIGGAKDPIVEEVIEINNAKGELQLVVAAVPFLRDRDLRNIEQNVTTDRREAIREGMRLHYKTLADHCKPYTSKVPAITMGHLYAKGATVSESERDIGNQSSISSDIFTDVFSYVALGHIHRPQIVANNESIRYSGSPIALSFSEKKDEKSVCLIETNGNTIKSIEVRPIPKHRNLQRIAGSFDEVLEGLKSYKNQYTLPSFIELLIKEDQFSPILISNVDSLIEEYASSDQLSILKNTYEFKKSKTNINAFFKEGIDIQEVSPLEIFKTKLEDDFIEEEKKEGLIEAFKEILQDLNQEHDS